jgi:hypothetical protein
MMRKGLISTIRTINRRNEVYNAAKANFQSPPVKESK